MNTIIETRRRPEQKHEGITKKSEETRRNNKSEINIRTTNQKTQIRNTYTNPNGILSSKCLVLHLVLLWVPFFNVFFLQFLQIFIVFFKFIFFFYETRVFKTRVPCGKNISMSAIDLEALRLDFFTELEPQRLEMLFSKLLFDSC